MGEGFINWGYSAVGQVVLLDDAGGILGEVTITDCIDTSFSPWVCGPYGFLLSSPVAYTDPILYRGQLGFFDIDESEVKSPEDMDTN